VQTSFAAPELRPDAIGLLLHPCTFFASACREVQGYDLEILELDVSADGEDVLGDGGVGTEVVLRPNPELAYTLPECTRRGGCRVGRLQALCPLTVGSFVALTDDGTVFLTGLPSGFGHCLAVTWAVDLGALVVHTAATSTAVAVLYTNCHVAILRTDTGECLMRLALGSYGHGPLAVRWVEESSDTLLCVYRDAVAAVSLHTPSQTPHIMSTAVEFASFHDAAVRADGTVFCAGPGRRCRGTVLTAFTRSSIGTVAVPGWFQLPRDATEAEDSVQARVWTVPGTSPCVVVAEWKGGRDGTGLTVYRVV